MPLQSGVEVRRSTRRKKTVSAYRRDGKVIVLIPARFTQAQEAQWVATMVARLDEKQQKVRSDAELTRRASEMSNEFLGGRADPQSVRWVDNMSSRWGSCTPRDGTIRISDRLQTMPGWVQDYVLLHELAHLLEPSHNAHFWSLVARYPKSERARGYLEGVVAAAGLPMESCDED